ncbi:MAG: hypothetical protein HZA89_07255 [Verrucomicrobia bacterium]|nr:hypothetical protein [Verrucomicrobiota bacterium]
MKSKTQRTCVRLLGFVVAALGSLTAAAADSAPRADAIRAAVAKSLPLLESGARISMEKRKQCFTCHNTALPVLALTAARERGFTIDEENLRQLVKFTADFLARNRTNYLAGKGQGGQALTAGYALWTLESAAWKSDATTAAVAEYLLQWQKQLEHWKVQTVRPPTEESIFTISYVALRGLKTFSTPEQRKRIDRRFEQVRTWVLKTPASSTEDRVFRLRLLRVAGATESEVRRAAQELSQLQRTDGGWAQLADMESDAYATGTALTALHQAGGVATSDAAYQRGLQWLLKAQKADGSWHVVTRSTPIQTYYESGYPHAENQFISITAASWATIALAEALPKTTHAEGKPTPAPAPKKKAAVDVPFKYGSPDEPLLEKLSLAKAAESLDRTSLAWVQQRKCGACHTTYPYLMSRMALGGEPSPAFAEVRRFFDDRTADWDANSKTNKHITRETVANAASLAVLDAQTAGKLQPLTRVALDKMWTLQRKDGAWNWPKCSWPPFEVDDYYGALLAALGVGHAPDGYAQGESARAGLGKLRAYFEKTPPPSLHHKAWLLWASLKLDGLMSNEQRKATTAELLALQRADGGWSMESLGKNWVGRESEQANPDAPSDGYGTGLVVFVLRQAGVPASHDALQRGVKWLSSNQRVSGRWFTRSMNGVEEHFISDTATAFAVLALKACE